MFYFPIQVHQHPESLPWQLGSFTGFCLRRLAATWVCPAYRGRAEGGGGGVGGQLMSRLWQMDETFLMPNITGAQPTGKVPHSPREAASLLSERGGASALKKCASFWQLLRPLPPPCPKASCRREPYGPLWTHFPWYSIFLV